MAEYKLDKRQNKTPYDIVRDLNNNYTKEYNNLINKEKVNNKRMLKEARACKRSKRFLSFRRFVFFIFLLLFLASSFLYSGFAADQIVAQGIVGLTALSLALSVFFFILAVFRLMYFKTFFMLTEIMLTLCTIAISLSIYIQFGMALYICISIASAIACLLNYIDGARLLSVKKQFFTAIVTFAGIAYSIALLLGCAPFGKDQDIYFNRTLYSRFEKYDAVSVEHGETWLEGVLLTIDDIIPTGEKKVYEVPSETKYGFKISGIYTDAFKGVTSIHTVILPDSVDSIYQGAFKNSSVHTVEFHSSLVYIADGFEGSSVRNVRLLSDTASVIVIGGSGTLAENVTFFVPKDLVRAYRTSNPTLADRIVAISE